VQLLFLVCAAGSDLLQGCCVFSDWEGTRDKRKGGMDKNIADQCLRVASFENGEFRLSEGWISGLMI